MTLDKVKQARCDCGKSYPLAHWLPNSVNNLNFVEKPDEFKRHKNKICSCCIRHEMVSLNEEGTNAAKTRYRKLAKMLGGNNG